jgi:hypothetical protein
VYVIRVTYKYDVVDILFSCPDWKIPRHEVAGAGGRKNIFVEYFYHEFFQKLTVSGNTRFGAGFSSTAPLPARF